jgi:transposase
MHWTSGRAYSQDLRDRVLAAVDAGEAVRAVAPRFGVSVSYVYKALIRRRESGEVAARTTRGRPPRKLGPHERTVEAFMRARQDATLADLRRHLLEAHGISVSLGAAWRTVRRLGLTLKKSPSRSRAGPGRRRPRAQALAAVAALPRP